MSDWIYYFLPSYWFLSVANKIEYLVRRRVLLLYLFWELLIDAGAFAVFYYFPTVAILGKSVKTPRPFLVIACWRGFTTMFGMISMCKRHVGMTRVFFVFFLLDCMFQIQLTRPLWTLRCNLDSYTQNAALMSFNPKIMQIHHPSREALWKMCGPACVPWHKPPKKSMPKPLGTQDMKKFKSQIDAAQKQRQPKKSGNRGGSLVDLETVARLLAERSQAFIALREKVGANATAQGELMSHLVRHLEREKNKAELSKRGADTRKGELVEDGEHANDTGMLSFHDHDYTKEEAKLRILNWLRTYPAKRVFQASATLEGYFTVVEKGISYPAVDPMSLSCVTLHLNFISRVMLETKLDVFRTKQLMEISLGLNEAEIELQQTLHTCAEDVSCGMVSLQFLVDCTATDLSTDQARCTANEKCEVKRDGKCGFKDVDGQAHQAELCIRTDSEFSEKRPEPLKKGQHLEETYYFKYEDAQKGRRRPMSVGKPISIYKLELNEAEDWVVAMEEIQTRLNEECFCDRGRTGSDNCNTYLEDASTPRKFWCYVSPASVPACIMGRNIRVFASDGNTKGSSTFWTEDLCHNQCICSGLGQYPHHSTKLDPEVRDDLLWANLMNFGESCEKWTVRDQEQGTRWCYVGFDTTCPDRWLQDSGSTHATHENDLQPPKLTDGHRAEVQGAVKQFRSRIAVDSKGGEKYCGNFGRDDIKAAMWSCTDVSWPASILAVIDLVLKVPVLLILWMFLSNRCMDELPVEEDYAPVWSDDDDDDDFSDGQKGSVVDGGFAWSSSGSSSHKKEEPPPSWRDRFRIFGKKQD